MARPKFDPKTHALWSRCDIGEKVFISDTSRVHGKMENVHIADGAFISDYTVLMAEAPLFIGPNVKIGFSCHVLAYAPLRIHGQVRVQPGAQVLSGMIGLRGWFTGPVDVGTGAVIGNGAVILPDTFVPMQCYVNPNEVFSYARPADQV
ncbi:MAG: hypothetical protein HC889_00635 [Synechococcaceae cyanobacterium SM1_2_3]|nr:hypothetical protein [Synechococcaceae cyanobacterium SM1_2_3]